MVQIETEERASPVAEFYEGKSIFMTGGTGFMGKVMIEKLLRSCPGINKIYILIRCKNSEDKNQRLEKIKNGRAFHILRTQHPERLKKLLALEGDIELPGLGLSNADTELLKEIDVVFNVAATLNFNEDLRKSVRVNVLATKTLLEICLSTKSLKSFVHVSTAYSNIDRDPIEERVYPSPLDLNELVEQCERCSDDEVDALTARVLGKRPNTYILTKALAESVVHSYKDKFPIAIVRPSVVSGAMKSPYPGWVDCKTGATGPLALIGTGLLRIMHGDNNVNFDIIPVDFVNNVIIVAAWRTALLGVREPIVYNAVTGPTNKLTLGSLLSLYLIHCRDIPLDSVIWYPSAFFTNNRLLLSLGRFLMHTVPAYLHDTLVPSSKLSLMRMHSSVSKVTDVLVFFMSNGFNFAYDNVPGLLGKMSERDRATFGFDNKEIEWNSYIRIYTQGIRRYLFKQNDEDIPQAKKRTNMYAMKHTILKVVAVISTYYMLVNWFTPFLVSNKHG